MSANTRSTSVLEVIAIAVGVLLIRFAYESALPFFTSYLNYSFSDALAAIMHNYPLAILMTVLDFLLVWSLVQVFDYGVRPFLRLLVEFAGVIIVSLMAAFMMRAMEFDTKNALEHFFNFNFLFALFVTVFFNSIFISVFDVSFYFGQKQKKAIGVEILKKNKARYQYQQLKRQMNPHFLFNSLNSLDYLIRTDNEKASLYVHKMESLYRYLLQVEEVSMVPLREEIDFIRLYLDLLKQRFDAGLRIVWELDDEALSQGIIPCGLQLLVENATKHNVISASKPLEIHIVTKDGWVIVSNNFQPKLYKEESTGFGLNSIKEQYRSMFDKEIVVVQTPQEFEVQIPLIKPDNGK